jgi:hypothetical protein
MGCAGCRPRAPGLTEIVAAARGEYRIGRRVNRNAAAELRPADQPLVSGGERPGDRERRNDRLQFRPDRVARLFRRHFAELARRGPPRARRLAPAVCCRACAGAGEYRVFPARHDARRDPRGGHRAARSLGRAPRELHRPWDRSVQRVSAGAASAPLRARRPRRGGAGEHGVQPWRAMPPMRMASKG